MVARSSNVYTSSAIRAPKYHISWRDNKQMHLSPDIFARLEANIVFSDKCVYKFPL